MKKHVPKINSDVCSTKILQIIIKNYFLYWNWKGIYCKFQIKNMSCLLISFREYFMRRSKHNSSLKIIYINFKLAAQKYGRGCKHSCKKISSLSLNTDGKFVIKD